MKRAAFALAALLATLTLAACGGGDDDDNGDDATPEGSPAATRAAGTATSGETETAGGETPSASSTQASGGSTPSTGGGGGGGGATFTIDDARALLQAALLAPSDVPGQGWTIGNDTTNDRAQAAAANPEQAASNERCGYLLSRLALLMNADQVTRYIGGETVSFFSTATVYETPEGATDCANETAARLADCRALADLFGGIFIDPAAVSCKTIDFPQFGETSAAIQLDGQISAAGTIVNLSILVVPFRQGAVTGAVGSAAAFDPSPDELQPLVEKVVSRIAEAQQ